MTETKVTDRRHAIAESNVEAILDGAERLLHEGRQPSISAVAKEAGVSRVTVYSHFEDRRRLLEALVERTVRRTTETVSADEPERGPATDALHRVIETSWLELGRHETVARASLAELGVEAIVRSHASARKMIRRLIDRGRREGAFRKDVRAEWLAASFVALIHAAAEEVLAGRLKRKEALETLSVTLTDLFAGPNR